MGILANENAISTGGYQISNSLRFQATNSQYLAKTPAVAGSRTTWTMSMWVKLGNTAVSGTAGGLFSTNSSTTAFDQFCFSGSVLEWIVVNGTTGRLDTTQVFRDPSAWYHIVAVWDSTNATAANRMRIYVNNVQITSFTTQVNPPLNQTSTWNNNVLSSVGANNNGGPLSQYFDGYMAEVNFIDGQALTPSSFGATNTLTGQWCAAKYTGTYGTNGFYLPFSNGTSTTTLGADSSGNGNNWTLTNFTRSAGVSDCWMYDVPSGNGSAGTQPNSNYAVLNPINKPSGVTLSAANLNYSSGGASNNCISFSTIAASSGKWYCEWTQTNAPAGQNIVGIGTDTQLTTLSYAGQNTTSYGYAMGGQKYNGTGAVSYGASWTTNDVIGIALDLDAGTLVFYKNGVSQGTAFTGLNGSFIFIFGNNAGATVTGIANFGQRSFAYTPPSGFKALCTANLPAATIVQGNKYMDATTYTGDGTSNRAIVNTAGFKPDLVWTKSRSWAYNHHTIDSVQGNTSTLIPNSTGAAVSMSTQFNSFNSNGYTISQDATYAMNESGTTYVGWQWQAGQGVTSSNTSGSITSTVSVNATAGFSVVTYTGNGTGGATVGHSLGVAPKMVIVKSRSGASEWDVYHASVGNTGALRLNLINATDVSSLYWNNTSPTSSVFSLGSSSTVNGNGSTFVAYCFAEIAGFSKFGSYTGNGSTDGTFVYLGFRPKYVMVKVTDTTGNWFVKDSSRSVYNAADANLYPNLANAEDTGNSVDLLSNGFKLRTSGTPNSANTYIYMAFAENPFAQANAR